MDTSKQTESFALLLRPNKRIQETQNHSQDAPCSNHLILSLLAALNQGDSDHAHQLANRAKLFQVPVSNFHPYQNEAILSGIVEQAVRTSSEEEMVGPQGSTLSDMIPLISGCLSTLEKEQTLKIGTSCYKKMISQRSLYSLLAGLINSPAQTKLISHQRGKANPSILSAKGVAQDLFSQFKEIQRFQQIAQELNSPNLWKTFRSLLVTDSTLQKDDILFCLEALVSSPNF